MPFFLWVFLFCFAYVCLWTLVSAKEFSASFQWTSFTKSSPGLPPSSPCSSWLLLSILLLFHYSFFFPLSLPPCPFKGLLKKQQAQRPHLEYLFSVFNVHSWHFVVESEVVKCHVQHARMEHYTASNMCVLFMSVSRREIIYIQVAYLVAPCSPESFNTPPYSNSTTSKCWHTHTWPGICLYHHTGWLLHKGCLTAALFSHTNNVLVPFLFSIPHSHTLTIC